jgi:small subunit ribosomal protein S9
LASIEYYATGRRKTSTARVFLRPGSGTITVNHREFDKYFTTDQLRTQVRRPLLLTETGDKFDILATVGGGGVNGQAGRCASASRGRSSNSTLSSASS